MARFPETEPQIVALAQSIIAGLSTSSTIYPDPPITNSALVDRLTALQDAQQTAVAAQSAALQATEAKDAALADLTEDMRTVLRYAENTVNGDDAKLKLLGWGGRSSGRALEAPGQCRTLEAPRQGDGWLFLDWKEPIDGGKVAAYKVQRRARPSGSWQDVATAISSEATLVDQPRGAEHEYRVVAVNRAGEGEASNTVTVVL